MGGEAKGEEPAHVAVIHDYINCRSPEKVPVALAWT